MLRFTLSALLVAALAAVFMLVFQIGRWDRVVSGGGAVVYMDRWSGEMYWCDLETGERTRTRDRYAAKVRAKAEAKEKADNERREAEERDAREEVLWEQYVSRGLVSEADYESLLRKRVGAEAAKSHLEESAKERGSVEARRDDVDDWLDQLGGVDVSRKAERAIKRDLLRKAGAKLAD